MRNKTKIYTEEGTKKVSAIVNERWSGIVKSVDPSGNILLKAVSGWTRSPLAGRRLLRVSSINGKSTGAGVTLTEDHSILTQRGYVAIRDLREDDLVATGYPVPGPRAEQVILGTLSGDGHISKTGRFREGHCMEQQEYLQYKIEVLSPFMENPLRGRPRKGLKGKIKQTLYHHTFKLAGKPQQVFQYRLVKSYYFHDLRKKWYPSGIKRVPSDISRTLNLFGAAIWYMDDGSYSTSQRTVRIALGSRIEEELEYCKESLGILGFASRIHKTSRGHYVLNLNRETTGRFLTAIAKYVPESMRYKLDEEALKIPFDPSFYEPEETKTGWRKVLVVTDDRKSRTGSIYCIDVEGTHNFMTPGGVVGCVA